MIRIINQYSFILTGVIVFPIIVFVSWYYYGIIFSLFVAGGTLFLLWAFQVVLKTRVKLHVGTENLEEYFNFGEPVLLVINSNY
tara:strand:- start:292 stop:543 length:252 start_codon:yes stop_codon:yes gene_type:complete